MPKTNEQEPLFDLEPSQKESKETIKGNRLSPSKLEKLSEIYEIIHRLIITFYKAQSQFQY